VRQVSTRAELLEDGRYSINGTKIFISCGEHDMTSNIVHLVLARIPGGPPGTHGLSLFAVPKHLVEAGEVSSAYNGVNIGRIEVRD
jgi:alkylation response protein AidB-like acyl-CoA dehydrogenase